MVPPVLVLAAAMLLGPPLVFASEPQTVRDAMATYASAELKTDKVGNPMIEAEFNDGTDDRYSVFFMDCEEGENCRSVTFYTWWNVTGVATETIDDWNEKTKFGRGYIDEDGNPTLELSVNLYGGVTRENFVDNVDWWHVVVSDYGSLVDP